MTDTHDPDPYAAEPPRDSRASPMDMTPIKPTVKVTTAFCVECQRALAAAEVKCKNCHGDIPTDFGK